jgi:salicylate hydroxylase
MVVYYIRGGELINFVACVDSDDWVSESWAQKADWEELRADFDGWHDDIVTLISAVDRDQCFPWALYNRPPRPDWSTERVTLMGDAIHPTNHPVYGPGGSNGDRRCSRARSRTC